MNDLTQAERDKVGAWLTERIGEVLNELDDWHTVISNVPEGVGRSSIKSLQALRGFTINNDVLDFGAVDGRIRSVSFDVDLLVATTFYREDWESSAEVRELVGVMQNDDFSCALDLEGTASVVLEITIDPAVPAVTGSRLRRVSSPTGVSIDFK